MTRPSEAEVTELMSVGQCEACGGPTVSLARHICEPCKARALSTPPLPSAEPVAWLREDGAATSPFAKREWPELNAAFTLPVFTTPPLPSAEPVAWPLADEDGRKGGWTYDFAWLERIADEVADEDNGRPCPEIVEGIALRLARTTPPAAAQDTGDDDDSFLADAAPTLLGQLSRKAVQAAVDEATDADGWVRFVDGQVVSRNALLNKLVALDSDAARAAGGE